MSNKTTWETFVLDGRHLVDAKIDFENRSVECTMITSRFGPIPFYSEKFAEPVDYLSKIINEAKRFIPQFDKMEEEYLNEESAE